MKFRLPGCDGGRPSFGVAPLGGQLPQPGAPGGGPGAGGPDGPPGPNPGPLGNGASEFVWLELLENDVESLES